MNLIDKIKDKYYARKLEKLKEEWVEEAEKNLLQHVNLPSIDELIRVVNKMKAPSLPSFSHFGDEYDNIESIFFDFPNADFIMKSIMRDRQNAIISNSTDYKEVISLLGKYATRYEMTLEDKGNDAIAGLESHLPIYKEILISEGHDPKEIGEIFGKFFYDTSRRLITEKELNKECELIEMLSEKMPKLIEKYLPARKTDFTRAAISEKFLEIISEIDEDKGKKIGHELDKRENFRKNEINLNENINFINANDPDVISEFKKRRDKKREELKSRDIDEDELMLVRTEDYFPINKKMEIIDELNNTQRYCPNIIKAVNDRILASEMPTTWNYQGNEFSLVDSDGFFNVKEVMNMYNREFVESEFCEQFLTRSEELRQEYGFIGSLYRSTKHFSLNGLVSSHAYGNFSARSFIFLDPFSEHKDDNMASFNTVDTYYNVSREKPFCLSEKAILMMPISRYNEIASKQGMRSQFNKYRDVTVFSGDEKIAVEMKLEELGVFSEEIGMQISSPDFLNDAMNNFCKSNEYVSKVHYYSEENAADKKIINQNCERLEKEFYKEMFDKFGNPSYTFSQSKVERELYGEYNENRSSCPTDLKEFINNKKEFNYEDIEKIKTFDIPTWLVDRFTDYFDENMTYDYVAKMPQEKFEEFKHFIQQFNERELKRLEDKRKAYFDKEKDEDLVR